MQLTFSADVETFIRGRIMEKYPTHKSVISFPFGSDDVLLTFMDEC